MSGRDPEPVSAFFPSIDRNLMRELEVHLRNAQPPANQPPVKEPAHGLVHETAPVLRPNVDGALDAVDQAAMAIATMTARIHELENHIYQLEGANDQLHGQLEQVTQQAETTEENLKTANERVERAEMLAAHHIARGNSLEQQLATVVADLTTVTDAINSRLALPPAPEAASVDQAD